MDLRISAKCKEKKKKKNKWIFILRLVVFDSNDTESGFKFIVKFVTTIYQNLLKTCERNPTDFSNQDR